MMWRKDKRVNPVVLEKVSCISSRASTCQPVVDTYLVLLDLIHL